MGLYDDQDKDVILSTEGRGEPLIDVVERRLTRRSFLKNASLLVVSAAVAGTATNGAAHAQSPRSRLTFSAITPDASTVDQIKVAKGYDHSVLIRWGDPLTADAPEFNADNQTAAAQAKQFGYNCDFVGFFPFPVGSNSSTRGLLAVNHEYTNPELMFRGYNSASPTKVQVDVEIEAHGVSIVEVQQGADRRWTYNRNSSFNRRYTGSSPMQITGPAATHPWLKTNADPNVTNVQGTLNNCAAGKTPWGTLVTAEENFHQYFGNRNALPEGEVKRVHARYGVPTGASERKWEVYHPRFDVAQEPNEAFRHGWSVEIDPYDPNFVPKKRTALGRFRHEAQTFIVTPSGKVAVYSGDDNAFDYVYKFVTAGTYNPNNRTANFNLLDEGTLYVAKFNDDGTGQWLPVVFGEGPLTAANGFTSQGDVLIKTRLAGDALGATKMDRPEDIEANPVNKKVYILLTSNPARGNTNQPGVDKANPRPQNRFGHIIELTEAGDDHAATTFNWEIFLLAGNPSDPSTYFAGFDKTKVSPIGNPDNVAFDKAGNMWIATDGQPGTLRTNDGLFAVPVAGPERGRLQQFFSSVAGSEVCGPEFTDDNTTLFLAIQHPGDGGTFDAPTSRFPDGNTPPRPSVIVVQANNGGVIGQAEALYLPNISR